MTRTTETPTAPRDADETRSTVSIPRGWAADVPKAYCSQARPDALEVARERFGNDCVLGFRGAIYRGHTIVGAVSVRRGDPLLPVTRRPEATTDPRTDQIADELQGDTHLLDAIRTEAGEHDDRSLCTLCTLAMDESDGVDRAALHDVATSIIDSADEQGISPQQLLTRIARTAGLDR